jgi:tyrosyl-tRNA synthetase
LDHDEISALDQAREQEPHQRASQRALAEELTRLIHGETGLAAAKQATDVFFGAEIGNLSDAELGQIFSDVPNSELLFSALDGEGLGLIDAIVDSGLAKSKGDARRSISQGGIYVNNRRVEDVNYRLTRKDLASESVIVLRSGKRKYALLRFS